MKERLDAALAQVTTPGPVIRIAMGSPIAGFEGFNDPYEGWYRGCRVVLDPSRTEGFEVVEADAEWD